MGDCCVEKNLEKNAVLKLDLECDKVMSLKRCLERYDLQYKDLDKSIPLASEFLAGTNYQRGSDVYTFVCFNATYSSLKGWQLRHLAGVTEMRFLLGAKTNEWSNKARKGQALLVPDGVWTHGCERIALEYDTGSYADKQLNDKIAAYAATYAAQIWGSPSHTRVARLEEKFKAEGLGDSARVLYATWW